MNDETTTAPHPIGLYHDPASKQYVGAIDPIQADAMIQQGWVLHTAGRDAAMSSQEDIDALKGMGKTEPAPVETTKKGK